MLDRLNIDLLYTDIFPLLDLTSIFNLYAAVPSLQTAIAQYKDWDLEYTKQFPDAASDSRTGLDKVRHRLTAKAYAWGFVPALSGSKNDTPANDNYAGGLGFVRFPSQIDLESMAPVRQFISDRCLLLIDGKIMTYSLNFGNIHRNGWELDTGWPSEVAFLRSSEFDAWCVHNDKDLYYQQPSEICRETMPSKVIWAEFRHESKQVLTKDGLHFGYPFAVGVWHLLLPSSEFPEEMISFQWVPHPNKYAFLSKSGKVYTVDSHNASVEWKLLDYSCKINAVIGFDLRYSALSLPNAWYPISEPYARGTIFGTLALGEDGHVYYWDEDTGVSPPFQGLNDIVKIKSKGSAFIALDKYGKLFFVGDTTSVNPGLGDRLVEDKIADDASILTDFNENSTQEIPGGTKPDFRKVLARQDLVSEGAVLDVDVNGPYLMKPRPIPIPGFAVDFNILARQVTVLTV